MIPIKIKVVAVDDGHFTTKEGKTYDIPKVFFRLVGYSDDREKVLNLAKGVLLSSFLVGTEVNCKLVLSKGKFCDNAMLSV